MAKRRRKAHTEKAEAASEDIYEDLDTPAGALVERLGSDAARGLDEAEARRRLQEHGFNETDSSAQKNNVAPRYFTGYEHFRIALVVLLLVSTVAFAFMGNFTEALVIFVLTVLLVAVGFIHEHRVSKMFSIGGQSERVCRVLREAKAKQIPARELVPGDLVLLRAGDRVPAECRVVKGKRFEAEGSRGELLKMSAHALEGEATAVVVETGEEAMKFVPKDEKTKAKDEGEDESVGASKISAHLCSLTKYLAAFIIMVSALLFASSYALGLGGVASFLFVIAMAVAAVPAGLPVAVQGVFGNVVRSWAAEGIFVSDVAALEKIGSIDVVCVGKEALTSAELSVSHIYVDRKLFKAADGGFTYDRKNIDPRRYEDLQAVLAAGVMCSDATIDEDGNTAGDAGEVALLMAAAKGGVIDARKNYARIDEIAFDPVRKMQSVAYKVRNRNIFYAKGDFEHVFGICSHILAGGKVRKINEEDKPLIFSIRDALEGRGYSAVSLAIRKTQDDKIVERGFTFLGMAALEALSGGDAAGAMKKLQDAGAAVKIFANGSKSAAMAFAKEAGLIDAAINPDTLVVTGEKMLKADDATALEIAESASIFVSLSQGQRAQVVELLRAQGRRVAVVGSGAESVAALRVADVAAAVARGTDAAQDAADIILDTDIAALAQAMEESRGIEGRVTHAARGFGAMAVMVVLAALGVFFSALALGFEKGSLTILLPAQFLWLALLVSGAGGFAGFESPQPTNISKSKYELLPAGSYHNVAAYAIAVGVIAAVISGGIYLYTAWFGSASAGHTAALAALLFTQLAVLPSFGKGRGARLAAAASAIAVVLFVISVYLPLGNRLLGTAFVGALEGGMAVVGALVVLAVAGAWGRREWRGPGRIRVEVVPEINVAEAEIGAVAKTVDEIFEEAVAPVESEEKAEEETKGEGEKDEMEQIGERSEEEAEERVSFLSRLFGRGRDKLTKAELEEIKRKIVEETREEPPVERKKIRARLEGFEGEGEVKAKKK